MGNFTQPDLMKCGNNRYQRRKCGVCSKTGVRLYRGYGEYLYPDRIRCNGCLRDEYVSNDVPLVADFYGQVETYFNTESDVMQIFLAQPEANPDGPTWVVEAARQGWSLAGIFLGSVTQEGAARDFSSIYPAK